MTNIRKIAYRTGCGKQLVLYPTFLDRSTCKDKILLSKNFFGRPSKISELGLFEDLDHL